MFRAGGHYLLGWQGRQATRTTGVGESTGRLGAAGVGRGQVGAGQVDGERACRPAAAPRDGMPHSPRDGMPHSPRDGMPPPHRAVATSCSGSPPARSGKLDGADAIDLDRCLSEEDIMPDDRAARRGKKRPGGKTPEPPSVATPRWVPAGVDFQRLPPRTQQAIVEIVNPAYEELVLGATEALERSTGLSIVHLRAGAPAGVPPGVGPGPGEGPHPACPHPVPGRHDPGTSSPDGKRHHGGYGHLGGDCRTPQRRRKCGQTGILLTNRSRPDSNASPAGSTPCALRKGPRPAWRRGGGGCGRRRPEGCR